MFAVLCSIIKYLQQYFPAIVVFETDPITKLSCVGAKPLQDCPSQNIKMLNGFFPPDLITIEHRCPYEL